MIILEFGEIIFSKHLEGYWINNLKKNKLTKLTRLFSISALVLSSIVLVYSFFVMNSFNEGLSFLFYLILVWLPNLFLSVCAYFLIRVCKKDINILVSLLVNLCNLFILAFSIFVLLFNF